MANPNGRKGAQWETDNVNYLKRWWQKIDRKTKDGAKDKGDLTHPEDWAVECKNLGQIDIPQFLREAEREASHKGARFFVALVKNRRGANETGKVEDGYAITRTRVWAAVAYEHEQALATLNALLALRGRRLNGGLSDSDFAVLVNEALFSHVATMHETALRLGGDE